MKSIIVTILAALALGGCTSMQQSVYKNTSTPYGNEVYATGEAAVAAAGASTTSNCPSCAVSGRSTPAGAGGRYGTASREPDPVKEVYREASRTLSQEISWAVSDAIRGAVRRW